MNEEMDDFLNGPQSFDMTPLPLFALSPEMAHVRQELMTIRDYCRAHGLQFVAGISASTLDDPTGLFYHVSAVASLDLGLMITGALEASLHELDRAKKGGK